MLSLCLFIFTLLGVVLRRTLVHEHPLRVTAAGTALDLPPLLFQELLEDMNVTVVDSVTRYFGANPYSYLRIPLPEQ